MSTSPTRSRGRCRRARARCSSSTRRRGSRRRRSRTRTSRSRTSSRSSRSRTRSTCRRPIPTRPRSEVADLLGDDPGSRAAHLGEDRATASTDVLDAIVERIPPPAGDPMRRRARSSSTRPTTSTAAWSRSSGSWTASSSRGDALRAMAHGHASSTPRSSASSRRRCAPSTSSTAGEVGYVVTGLKDVSELRVGDTLTSGRGLRPSRCPATRT